MAFLWTGKMRTGDRGSVTYGVHVWLWAGKFYAPSSPLLLCLLPSCYGYATAPCCLLIPKLSGDRSSWRCVSRLPSFLLITAPVSWPPWNFISDHFVFESCRCSSGGVSRGHLDHLPTRNQVQVNLHSPNILLNQFLKTFTEKPQLS